MSVQLTYLDHNAGAPLRPAALQAMVTAMQRTGNPSSVHAGGRDARAAMEKARQHVADLVHCDPASVIFTSGGTEANNMVLQGVAARHIVLSDLEHPSVRDVRDDVNRIPVLPSGIIDISALDAILSDLGAGVLVSVMAANNETGILQPIQQVGEICARHNAIFHCDMAQWVGRAVVSIANSNVAFATVSGHKLGGPSGIGAVIAVNSAFHMAPILRGGGQERRRRAGTENVAGIVGFGMAAAQAADDLHHGTMDRVGQMRDRMEQIVLTAVPDAQVVGKDQKRLCNTTCLILPSVPAQVQVMALDLAGIAVSAGSACSSGKVLESPVLRAMGYDTQHAGSAIRVSLGPQTEWDDIERFVMAWSDLARRKGFRVTKAA